MGGRGERGADGFCRFRLFGFCSFCSVLVFFTIIDNSCIIRSSRFEAQTLLSESFENGGVGPRGLAAERGEERVKAGEGRLCCEKKYFILFFLSGEKKKEHARKKNKI